MSKQTYVKLGDAQAEYARYVNALTPAHKRDRKPKASVLITASLCFDDVTTYGRKQTRFKRTTTVLNHNSYHFVPNKMLISLPISRRGFVNLSLEAALLFGAERIVN